MIIRQAILRHGRHLAPRPVRPLRRSYADIASLAMLERSLDNSLQQTHHIENELQDATIDAVPRIDNITHMTQQPNDTNVLRQYRDYQHQQKETGRFGSNVDRGFVPDWFIEHPPRPEDVTLEMLMAAQAHMGHATALWNPMNSRWIFGVRQGMHIIALEQTAAHLRRACRVVEGVAERAGLVLFVGTRRGHQRAVVGAARRAGGYHLFDRWRPGAITNRLSMLGGFELQAVDPLDRPLKGFTEELNEWPPVTPDLVICLNPRENWVLLHECGLASIPTIGIIDTNADPTWVTYPIPANDDSLRCIQVIAGALGMAGQSGTKRRLESARKGTPTHKTINMEQHRIQDP